MKLPKYSELSANPSEHEMAELTVRSVQFLGVHSTSSHCSEVQHSNLLKIIGDMCDTYNSLPSHHKTGTAPACVEDIMRKFTGQVSDHANDQKALFRIRRGYKERIWMDKLSKDRLESLGELEIADVFEEERSAMWNAVGGAEAWEGLDLESQKHHRARARAETMSRLAAEGFAALPEAEKLVVQTCIWSGCASHKAMNIFKGGEQEMHKIWQPEDQHPITLLNKDNLGAVAHLIDNSVEGSREVDETDPGYGEAQRRAIGVSDGGGHKTTSLAAGVFNHKDKKKGQQQTYRVFLERTTGKSTPVADASNNRYGSHGDTASGLITYHKAILEFLVHMRDAKVEMTWTNMEHNVYIALQCPSTLSELCAMSIFSETIFHPWMNHARAGEADLHVNGLDEGPWYERAMEFIASVIILPDIVLGDYHYGTATLDGKPWNNIDAIYASREMASGLPDARRCVVGMFQGALAATASFLQEYEADGEIDRASPLVRELAYRPPTNDRSEGQLGSLRRADRHNQSRSTLPHNSAHMYAENDTAAWHARHLDTQESEEKVEFGSFVSVEARRREKSGEAKQRQLQILLDAEQKAEVHRVSKRAKQAAEEKERLRISKIALQRDPLWPSAKGITIPLIKEQLLAYRTIFKEKFGKLSANKAELIEVVSKAITRYNDTQQAPVAGGLQEH